MTPDELRSARRTLGELHGLGRPYTLTEFGRLLRLGGVRPDQSVRDYERGKTAISGPLSLAVELMLFTHCRIWTDEDGEKWYTMMPNREMGDDSDF